MSATGDKLKLYRKRFALLFFVSLLALVVIFGITSFEFSSGEGSAPDSAKSPPTTNAPSGPIDHSPTASSPRASSTSFSQVTAGVSLLSSVVSLLGVISTTVLAWKKERRDSQIAAQQKPPAEQEAGKVQAPPSDDVGTPAP